MPLFDIIVVEPQEPPARLGEALSLAGMMALYFAGMVLVLLAVAAVVRRLRRRSRFSLSVMPSPAASPDAESSQDRQ